MTTEQKIQTKGTIGLIYLIISIFFFALAIKSEFRAYIFERLLQMGPNTWYDELNLLGIALLLIGASLNVVHFFYASVIYPRTYLEIIKNKGFDEDGNTITINRELTTEENYSVDDFSKFRGLAASFLIIAGVILTTDSDYRLSTESIYGLAPYQLAIICFLFWITLNMLLNRLTCTSNLFQENELTLNTHLLFPGLLKEEKLQAPLEAWNKYESFDYLTPSKTDEDWSSDATIIIVNNIKNKITNYQKTQAEKELNPLVDAFTKKFTGIRY